MQLPAVLRSSFAIVSIASFPALMQPAEATAVPITGTLHTYTLPGNWTNGSNLIAVATTNGLVIGSTITAPGFPAGTSVTNLTATTITCSAAATAPGTNQSVTVRSSIVTAMSSNTGVTVGQAVSGTGVAPGTVVTGIASPTQLTLSTNATGNGTQMLGFTVSTPGTMNGASMPGTFAASSVSIAVASTVGLLVGSRVTGTGIAANSVITALAPSTITISNPTLSAQVAVLLTISSPTVSNVMLTSELVVGNYVAGAGVPAGTTIAQIAGTTLTLSQNATSSGQQKLVFGATQPSLDIDLSTPTTTYDALTDGVMIMRRLFGQVGTSITEGAVSASALRVAPDAIQGYLESIAPFLDADGNGTNDALTDGLLLLRYLFGLRAAALTSNAVAAGAPRSAATDIQTYIQSLMP